jgi:hypothetical protein
LGSELLLNAKELFGFTDHTLSFWKPIFTILNKQFGFTENYNRLLNDIKEELNLNLPLEKIHYEKINDDDNIDLIKGIFDSLGIIIEDFNNLSINKLSLENRHKKRLKSYFNNREKAVKASLWNSLKSGGIEKQERFLNLLNNYERHHSFIVEVSEKYKQEFEIDEVVVFNNFIAKEFENLIIQDAEVDLISILKKNEAKFSEDELDDINNSTSLKSLLYFSESLNHIKDTIAPISKDNPILVSQNVLPNSFDYNISVMKNYKTNTIPVIIGQEGSSNGVYTPNQSTPKNLKRIGNTSEGIVYQKMIELYSDKFVIWKSKENEGLHYDFKYSPDKGQTWKYADAKTFSNNTFYLSRHEEEFGKQNKSNYEIWLICPNQEIKIITDLFSNSCYILNPKDYIVHITELMEISNN